VIKFPRVIFSHARMESFATHQVKKNVLLFMNCLITSQGRPVAEAVRSIGVTEITYYRWRQEHGGLKSDQVKRLKELERRTVRLPAIVDGEPKIYASSGGMHVEIPDAVPNPYLFLSGECPAPLYHIEIWAEKSTINDVLEPLAARGTAADAVESCLYSAKTTAVQDERAPPHADLPKTHFECRVTHFDDGKITASVTITQQGRQK
jgi:hypothetical protein